MINNIWLIGAGNMALEYSKVLNALAVNYLVIGRSFQKAENFKNKTGINVICGGIQSFLKTNPEIPAAAIVATNITELAPTTISLLNYGIKLILVEKPGFCTPDEIKEVELLAQEKDAVVCIAYNRRFYASVLAAEKIITEDNGLTSFNFEFTEWASVIEKTGHPKKVLENFFYANSTHVIDLAFFIGKNPTQISTYTKPGLDWHKNTIFVGAGITEAGTLFNYQANWMSPGRWGLELLTNKRRIYLRPLEKVQIQSIGSVSIENFDIDDSLDKEFKPGLYLETKTFLEQNFERHCLIQQQIKNLKHYKLICPE